MILLITEAKIQPANRQSIPEKSAQLKRPEAELLAMLFRTDPARTSVALVLLVIACSGPVAPSGPSGLGAAAGEENGPILVGNLGAGGGTTTSVSGANPRTPGAPNAAATGGQASLMNGGVGGRTLGLGGSQPNERASSGGAASATSGAAGGGGKLAEARCGDGVIDTAFGETCDDGNQRTDDACPDGPRGTCAQASCSDGFRLTGPTGEVDVDCGGPVCGACPGALLLSEVVVSPTAGEYIEIVNSSELSVSLDHVYLADYPGYFADATHPVPPHSSDFRVSFPKGASIPAKARIVVALKSATAFFATYGQYPDYDFSATDSNAAHMLGVFSSVSGLSDGAEMVVLFRYVPGADRVADLDYLIYGNTSDAVDKSSTPALVTPYAPDTPASAQHAAAAPKASQALVRCDETEGPEKSPGGNGYLGHDETSEGLDQSFRVLPGPTPGAATTGCPVPKGN